jgi:hypothetical protein
VPQTPSLEVLMDTAAAALQALGLPVRDKDGTLMSEQRASTPSAHSPP